MEKVTDEFAVPPLAPDRPIDVRVYYDAYADTLVVSFVGSPEPGMNFPVDDESIDLRISLDEKVLLGLEIPNFTYAFLPEHPEFLDLAASAGVPTEVIQAINAQISTAKRQRSAVDALLRQFAKVSLTK